MATTRETKTTQKVREEKEMTQKEQVLKHLKRYAGLTTLTAYDRYSITRLAARVSELRADGYEIASIPKNVVNRYGEKCRVAEYRLVK
jgi:hypothetical protein